MGTFVENVNKLAADLTPGNLANIEIVALNQEDISLVADSILDVSIVADNVLDVNTTASSIANVNLVGESIASVDAIAPVVADMELLSPQAANIGVVATNITSVITTATNIDDVNIVAADIGQVAFDDMEDLGLITDPVTSNPAGTISYIKTVADDIANVNTVGVNIVDVGTVVANVADVNIVADNILDINAVADTIVPNIVEILEADTNAATATTKAAEAQLRAWDAVAARMTADSYATEPEDVFVKIYVSNDDGTYTSTDTLEYSALHHAAKSGTVLGTLIDDTTPKLDKTYSSVKVVDELNNVLQTVLALNTYSAQGQFGGSTPVVLTTTEQVVPFAAVVQSTDTAQFEIGTNTITIKSAGTYSFISNVVFEDLVDTGLEGVVTFNLRDATTDALYYSQSTGVKISGYGKDSIAFNSLVIMPVEGTYPLTFDINAVITGPAGIESDYRITEIGSVISKQGGNTLTGEDIITLINAAPSFTLDLGGI